ncbi:MAG TPA: DNA polymerase IV [Candidatus Thermoplasmatota archaeon]|nr:DNA polymerase IV [Candidatus Thermoplasmatota archaeon]
MTATAPRRILHVDLDAFYASVEELDHPEWAGSPLVVGADPQEGRGRGVVTTANYEARRFGIRSAMPIGEAWRRCPTARFVFPRFERYAAKSEEVFAILREACRTIEPASIDEGYVDATGQTATFAEAVGLARTLQARIREAARLSASFGVASNKLVAKIATDMRKPGGLTPVEPGTEAAFLAPLPARKIPGVGPKTEARLAQIGVATCGQLAALPPRVLAAEFGTWGPRLAALARGEDDAPVETAWERKSLGSETTFLRDEEDPAAWEATLRDLARQAAAGAREEGVMARTVTVKVRYAGFETHTHARTLPRPTDDPEALAAVALDLLRENPPPRAVRLLGVRLSHLQRRGALQTDLSRWPADVLGEAGAWRPAQRRLDEA